MFRYIKYLMTALCGFVFLTSCEENITLDLPDYEPKLAVHCILKPGEAPVLFLNRSKSYFDYSDTSRELQYISDAQVIITDVSAGMNDTLKFDFSDGFYEGKLIPKTGQKYILHVTHKGKQITAETTVPQPVEITGFQNNMVEQDDGFGYKYYEGPILVKFNDQAGMENAYSARVIERQYISFNGRRDSYMTERQDRFYNYDRGTDGREMHNEYWSSYSINEGIDSIVLEVRLENHTLQTAEYLESVQNQNWTSGDPFTEPVMIKHNITGGLGIFGATTIGNSKRFKVK